MSWISDLVLQGGGDGSLRTRSIDASNSVGMRVEVLTLHVQHIDMRPFQCTPLLKATNRPYWASRCSADSSPHDPIQSHLSRSVQPTGNAIICSRVSERDLICMDAQSSALRRGTFVHPRAAALHARYGPNAMVESIATNCGCGLCFSQRYNRAVLGCWAGKDVA